MKKLFENWKRYINEGDDKWYDEEGGHETMADMKWAEDPDNPLYKNPEAEDVPEDEEGAPQQDNVEVPDGLNERATSLWVHLNGLLEQWQPMEAEAVQYKKDLFALMNDFLKSPDRPSPESEESASPEEEYTMLPRPKEDPMGRGARTSKLRRQSTNWRPGEDFYDPKT